MLKFRGNTEKLFNEDPKLMLFDEIYARKLFEKDKLVANFNDIKGEEKVLKSNQQ